jgi:hypothetical protein
MTCAVMSFSDDAFLQTDSMEKSEFIAMNDAKLLCIN